MEERRKRIAVVGSGIAGLAALHALHQDGFEVDLYEKEGRIGGDAHTIEYKREGKESCWVETAFLLLHQPGWPNFFAFLQSLGVELQPSIASLSITCRNLDGGDEWGWKSTSLSTFFPAWSDLLDLSRYRLLYDILRFNITALDVLRLESGVSLETTVVQYLAEKRYSVVFRDHYLLPLFSCIHSIPLSASAEFPIICLVQMFHNLRLLQLWGKPQWYVIKGGSRKYVDAILSSIPSGSVRTGIEVVAVSQKHSGEGVSLRLASGETRDYDHVILATHSDVTRRILLCGGLLDDRLNELLSSWKWVECQMHVHHDESVLPADSALHAAWNGQVVSDHISATFDMNLLLSLPTSVHGRILTTLNPHPSFPLDKAKIISSQRYAQPVLSPEIVRAQIGLSELQAQPSRYPGVSIDGFADETAGAGTSALKKGRIVIAGAWTGSGIHEDGFVSGVKAAESVGATPRKLVPSDRAVPAPGLSERVGRLVLLSFGLFFR